MPLLYIKGGNMRLHEKLTRRELQQVMLEAKSVKHFQEILGLNSLEAKSVIEQNLILSPTSYVRSLLDSELIYMLLCVGSFDELAKKLGVSAAFIKQHLRGGAKAQTKQFTKEYLEEELTRVGSVRLLARFNGVSEAEIRTQATALGVNPNVLIDLKSSNLSTGKGARAEAHYAALRKEKIVKDMNVEDHSKAPFDFQDLDYGRVNVKSSAADRFKAKSRKKQRFWKFSTRGVDNADNFALVFYDRKYEEVFAVVIISTEKVKEYGTSTITITQDELKALYNKQGEQQVYTI